MCSTSSRLSDLAVYANTGKGHCRVFYECLDAFAVPGAVVEVQTKKAYFLSPYTFTKSHKR